MSSEKHRLFSQKLIYFPDTDTLYIDLADRPSMESEVVNDSLIIDLDSEGRPVGITVEHYSQSVTTQTIEVNLPGERSPAAIKPSPDRQRHPAGGDNNGEYSANYALTAADTTRYLAILLVRYSLSAAVIHRSPVAWAFDH